MTATTGATGTDERIRNAVLRQLNCEPYFDTSSVRVSVDDGVATLTGMCESYAEKLAIERAVKRVNGVRGVANDLRVKLTGVTR